jgi:hypothetical protein
MGFGLGILNLGSLFVQQAHPCQSGLSVGRWHKKAAALSEKRGDGSVGH